MPALGTPNATPVALSVEDGRPANQAVYHVKRVRFGVVEQGSGPAPGLDPPDQLRSVHDALTEALGRRGFRLAPGGRAMQVTVLDPHACTRWERRNPELLVPGTLVVTPAEFMVASRALLRVTVRDAAGRETFVRDYEGGPAGMDYRPWPAARRLDEALTAVAAATVQDYALVAALQSSGAAGEASRPEPLRVGDYRQSC